MTAVKGLVLGIVVVSGVALEARGEAVRRGSWRWTSWASDRGVYQMGPSGASEFSPPAPPPAPIAPPPAPIAPAIPVPPPSAESWQSLGRFATTSPVASAPPVGASPAPVAAVDLFLNFGDGPYPRADTLTNGGAQPWYVSPVVTRLFGGVPDGPQRAAFTDAVLRRVEQVYHQSGLSVSVTTDPGVRAAHTLSVVSHTFNASYRDAIGITCLGTDGFSFIDKFGEAKSTDELAIALGNNLLHESAHAFGVGHHDLIGQSLDAGKLSWSILSNAATGFSAAAVQDLASRDFRRTSSLLGTLSAEVLAPGHLDTCACSACQGLGISPAPVPEPATLGLWAVAVSAMAMARRLPRRPGLETTPRA